MDAGTRSFQEVLSELRATKIGNDLPSPAEILHGRSLITGEPVTVDQGQSSARRQADQRQPAVQQEPQGQDTESPGTWRKVLGYWHK